MRLHARLSDVETDVHVVVLARRSLSSLVVLVVAVLSSFSSCCCCCSSCPPPPPSSPLPPHLFLILSSKVLAEATMCPSEGRTTRPTTWRLLKNTCKRCASCFVEVDDGDAVIFCSLFLSSLCFILRVYPVFHLGRFGMRFEHLTSLFLFLSLFIVLALVNVHKIRALFSLSLSLCRLRRKRKLRELLRKQKPTFRVLEKP
jgi:hypothetical protein